MTSIETPRPHGSKLPIGLSWIGLGVVLLMIALAMVAQISDHQEVGIVHVAMLMFVASCFAASYVATQRLFVEKLEPRVPGWQKLVIRSAAVVIAVFAGAEIAAQVLGLFGCDVAEHRRNYLPVGLGIMVAVAVADFGYERLKRRAREIELREERARRKAIDAELAALRARTDPHFLFNSLNTVAGLIEEDPRKATEVVERLSGVFRYALEGSRRETVRLSEELQAVEAYLEIEGIRFGDRFGWSIEVGDDVDRDLAVPPLFLQPVVENAVIHGVGPKRGRGRVDVRVTNGPAALRIEVEDDGGGFGTSPITGSGTAMADLRERLDLLYGSAGSISFDIAPSGGARILLEIPFDGERRRS